MKKIQVLLLFIGIFYSHLVTSQTISYELSMSQPQTHYFEVKMTVNNLQKNVSLNKAYIDFKMPVWTPGSYLIREYAKNVDSFTAKAGEKATTEVRLPFDKINKNTWRVQTNGADKITISYKVYAYEMSVRTSFLDDTHGYLNGASIFMYVPQLIKSVASLKITPFKDWNSISTALKKSENNSYIIQDFDTLVDSPIEIGTHKILSFTSSGIPHTIAMYSNGAISYDEKQLLEDYKKVTEAATSVVGEHPCKDYTFIVHHLPNIGGGLEHLYSSTCQTSPTAYTSEATYKSFMGLVAHEYFHLWNVKRIRPIALGPFDYDNENYTHMLWVSEGFTSFYQEYLLRRANLYTPEQYLDRVTVGINGIENQAGRKFQSVAESSWDAWIKYYRPNENSKNSTISYYDKGGVLGGLLNLYILGETNGKKNLDDVYKALWNDYYKKLGRGFKDEEFQATCEKIAGKPMGNFFQKYVWGTDEIDYNAFFNYVGMKLVDTNADTNTPYLGAAISGNKITSVALASGAYEGGLNANDEIMAVDNIETSSITNAMTTKKVDDKITIKVKRSGQFFSYDIPLKRSPAVLYKLQKLDNITKEQEEIYKKWLYLP